MATSDQFIGRREAVGLGIEATPGTAVAPQVWLRWLTNGIQPKTDVIENESAIGVVDRVADSEIVSKYVEGTLGGKINNESIGFLLLGLFGSVSTGAASGGIYPHTFSLKPSSVPTTLTTALVSPLASERHAFTVIDNLEITAEAGGWIEASTALKGRVGATSSETVSLTDETEYTSKHITLKIAANTAGLAGATAIKASRINLMMNRPSEAYNPLGTDDEPEFDKGAFEARGEVVIRLTDTQYESDFLANTIKAMSISLVNDDESLVFTAAKVRYRELEKTRDRDNVVTATIQFFCEYDTTATASITPVLRNTRATYVAA